MDTRGAGHAHSVLYTIYRGVCPRVYAAWTHRSCVSVTLYPSPQGHLWHRGAPEHCFPKQQHELMCMPSS
eukprot:20323-Eustigmatos_ZCMA.PRE.1